LQVKCKIRLDSRTSKSFWISWIRNNSTYFITNLAEIWIYQ